MMNELLLFGFFFWQPFFPDLPLDFFVVTPSPTLLGLAVFMHCTSSLFVLARDLFFGLFYSKVKLLSFCRITLNTGSASSKGNELLSAVLP
jgi:hypothetical protein